jgi:prepilin-type processing-associated H-X9-DG protein
VIFVAANKVLNKDKVVAALAKDAREEKYKGQNLHVADEVAVCFLSDRVFISGRTQEVKAALDKADAKPGEGLGPVLTAAAGKHHFVFGVNPAPIAKEIEDKIPPQGEPFKPLLKARSAVMTVDTGKEVRANLVVTFPKDADAKEGAKAVWAVKKVAQATLSQGIKQLAKQKEAAKLVEFLRQIEKSLDAATVKQSGAQVVGSARVKTDSPTFAVMVLQAVQKVREASSRSQSVNNLKQIGLAMHNYHDTFGTFPAAAIYSKDGKPLLSWRVAILPFIEQDALYKKFKLDEPWDSPHNKKLLAQMPRVYASPDEKAVKAHATYYQGFHGPGAFFDGKRGIRIASITDGTSNTLMIVEAGKAVPWSKPEDLPYDPKKPVPKLGGVFPSGFNAVFCDGSVRHISKSIKEKVLRLLITRDDGEVIPMDFDR